MVMNKTLVIVESPAKARTINRYLGNNYIVKASMGHIKDLPKTKLGVDEEHNFTPTYIVIPKRRTTLKELKKTAKDINNIYLAPDPDREGEAICWHLYQELKNGDKHFHRILLQEITKGALIQALQNPTEIDMRKVEAQQARRILDRLVGYKISPLLWAKVKRGLSAGRVQSVALRLICEREKEIESFIPQEYWTVKAKLAAKEPPSFIAKLINYKGKKIDIKNKQEAEEILSYLKDAHYIVNNVKREEKERQPAPPFKTSTLQQEAYRKLNYSAKKTMKIAQQLYEGKDLKDMGSMGLITYMRTDSLRMSNQALAQAKSYIINTFGNDFYPAKTRVYRNKKGIQDAHEAIRPTSVERTPELVKPHLSAEEYKLYELIWKRFLASQMSAAIFDVLTIEVLAGEYLLQASGRRIKFPGFITLYKEMDEQEDNDNQAHLPVVSKGEELTLEELIPEQNFTKPPPRYNDATLVKELDENGIGRPSTYASILSTIQERGYVSKEKGRFVPGQLGMLVNQLLLEHFKNLVDVKYTARMEEKLDEIEEGNIDWVSALQKFYDDLEHDLSRAQVEMPSLKAEKTDQLCEKCGSPMVIKWGKFGQFLACSNFPQCRFAKEIDSFTDEKLNHIEKRNCPRCGQPMVVKKGKFGPFLACSSYPQCKTTMRLVKGEDGSLRVEEEKILEEKCPLCGKNLSVKRGPYGDFIACLNYPECNYIKPKETGVSCPRAACNGIMVEKRSKKGKLFYGCSKYPECDFILWDKPVPQKCPKCDSPYLLERRRKGGKKLIFCGNKNCNYKEIIEQDKDT